MTYTLNLKPNISFFKMPKYFYTAKSLKSGELESGTLETKDEKTLAQVLHQKDLILIKAEVEKEKRKFEFPLPFFGVSLTEKMFFARNLRVMISAGLPLPRALQTLATQAKSEKFKYALLEIAQDITMGKSFSESLALYPDIFSEFFLNMIRVGEEAGTLEEVLNVLAQHMERENALRSKIQGAMIYPSIIICALIGVGILMLFTLVPRLGETFEELKIELPFTTKIVINLSKFLVQKWYLILIVLVPFLLFFYQFLRTRFGKKIVDAALLKTPLISPLIRKTNSAYTMRTLCSLVSAGISLPKSLEITSGTLENIFYREAIWKMAEKVRRGEKLSEALKPYEDIYPSTVIQMISVGEETGETTSILEKLADFYEEEVSNTTKNLTSIIEPFVMIIVGIAVGFFAISMIKPLYTMLGAIK